MPQTYIRATRPGAGRPDLAGGGVVHAAAGRPCPGRRGDASGAGQASTRRAYPRGAELRSERRPRDRRPVAGRLREARPVRSSRSTRRAVARDLGGGRAGSASSVAERRRRRSSAQPLEHAPRASSVSGSPRHRHSTVRSLSSTAKQTPWSTPVHAAVRASGSRWPPLRSALLTTRRGRPSARRSGWSLRAQREAEVDRSRRRRPTAGTCPGRTDRRASPSAARGPSRSPPTRRTRRPRGRPACRPGSPTAAAPRRPACRRSGRLDAVEGDRAVQRRVGRVDQPARSRSSSPARAA